MRKIGLFIHPINGTTNAEFAHLMKQYGFDAACTDNALSSEKEQAELAELINKNGLFYESIHAPFDHMNDIWHDTADGQQMLLFAVDVADGGGQGQLLIAAALALAGQMNDGLAAGEEPDDKGVFSHRTYCIQCKGDPMTDEWVEMGQIKTGWESFTIDSTTFVANGKRYFCWAQRDYAIPGNSNLYIAEMISATELKLPATLLSCRYRIFCTGRGLPQSVRGLPISIPRRLTAVRWRWESPCNAWQAAPNSGSPGMVV